MNSNKTKFVSGVSIAIVSLTVSLLLAELLVRTFAPQSLSGVWGSNEVYYPNKAYAVANHRHGERHVTYRINSLKQRGDEPVPDKKKILILGDSYTFGWLLDEDDTYVALMQHEIEKSGYPYQLLNAGTGGWGADNYLRYLEEYIATVKPDSVVVFFSFDDITRSLSKELYILDETKTSIERVPDHLSTKRLIKYVVNAVPGYESLLEHSHLIQLVRLRVEKLLSNRRRKPTIDQLEKLRPSMPIAKNNFFQDALTLGECIFKRMKELCDLHNAKLIVITNGFLSTNNKRDVDAVFLKNATEFFRSLKVPFHDIRPELLESANNSVKSLRIKGDGHPNERGAALIARHAWNWLEPIIIEEHQK